MSQEQYDSPILITGCARSGTSLVAGIIDICGAWGGSLAGPTQWNKKGMFENSYIREKMVKPYLRVIAADPKGQDPLPDTRLMPIVQDWHEMFYSAMRAQGWDGEKQLFYKGAKMCLMWPVWSTAFPYAKWVIVGRDDEGVISSCLRTSFMNAFKEAEGWQRWVDHHKKCLREMKAENLDTFEIWTPSIIKGNLSEVEEMIEWLGLEWKEDEVKKFISPELWHGGVG